MSWSNEESTIEDHIQEMSNADDANSFDWAEFNASLGPPDDVTDLASFEFPEPMNWSTLDDFLVDLRNNGDVDASFVTSGNSKM
jgi:hypothetical protein